MHAGLRQSDCVHGCHVSHSLGTDTHVRLSQNSVEFWNAKTRLLEKQKNPAAPPANVPREDDFPEVSNIVPEAAGSDTITAPFPDLAMDLDEDVVPHLNRETSPEDTLADLIQRCGLRINHNSLTSEVGNCWLVLYSHRIEFWFIDSQNISGS